MLPALSFASLAWRPPPHRRSLGTDTELIAWPNTDDITSPTSSIITKDVTNTYIEAAGDFELAVPYALLMARQFFRIQAREVSGPLLHSPVPSQTLIHVAIKY